MASALQSARGRTHACPRHCIAKVMRSTPADRAGRGYQQLCGRGKRGGSRGASGCGSPAVASVSSSADGQE
eukprot:2376631-Rhodomonas_salina.1